MVVDAARPLFCMCSEKHVLLLLFVHLAQLYYDLVAVTDVAKSLPPDSDAAMEALFVANKMINTYRWMLGLGAILGLFGGYLVC